MATLTTARLGIPYPDGNERVMDGDNAMGAIAAHLDDLAKSGVPLRAAAASVNGTFSGTVSLTITTTFPVGRFTTVPFIIATPVITTTTLFVCHVASQSATGCQFICERNDRASHSGALNVFYWAFQL